VTPRILAAISHSTQALVKSARYDVVQNEIWQLVGTSRICVADKEANAHFFPLMRVFTGKMIHAIQRSNGRRHVVVPSIVHLDQLDTVFEPLNSIRNVIILDPSANLYGLDGGAYETPIRLVLHDDGLLDHYSFVDGQKQDWLCQLELSP
jgi:hypothetical protein